MPNDHSPRVRLARIQITTTMMSTSNSNPTTRTRSPCLLRLFESFGEDREVLRGVQIDGCTRHRHSRQPIGIALEHGARALVAAQRSELGKGQSRKGRRHADALLVDAGGDQALFP